MSAEWKEHSSRVLSIQSHVVHGNVGNKCATLPLQLHGFEVDAINSVQFSTHTFYPGWKGQVLNTADLTELYDGLKTNEIHKKYTHLLTGYCRDETFLRKIAEILTELKGVNPKLFYICDPVLGDRDQYYVPEHLMAIYRDIVMPLADIITPNQFELQELSGVKVHDESSALVAMRTLHKKGNEIIVVTSTDLAPNPLHMFVYASTLHNNGEISCHRFTIERLEQTFVGTGDVFSALLLAWMLHTNNDLCASVHNVLVSLQSLLRRTVELATKEHGDSQLGVAELELRLVHSQSILTQPNSLQHLQLVSKPVLLTNN